MKIYILTCINEESTLVSCKPYKNLDSARADMQKQLYDIEEYKKADRGGSYIQNDNMSGYVGDDAYCYIFNITEAELDD